MKSLIQGRIKACSYKIKKSFNFNDLNSLNFLSYKAFGRIYKVKLADLGEATKEATIQKWLKKVGDLVKEEENIVEVSNDKQNAEIPSPVTGKIIKINYQEEKNCLVGEVLCEIESQDDNSEKQPKAENPQDSEITKPRQNPSNDPSVKYSELDKFKSKETTII